MLDLADAYAVSEGRTASDQFSWVDALCHATAEIDMEFAPAHQHQQQQQQQQQQGYYHVSSFSTSVSKSLPLPPSEMYVAYLRRPLDLLPATMWEELGDDDLELIIQRMTCALAGYRGLKVVPAEAMLDDGKIKGKYKGKSDQRASTRRGGRGRRGDEDDAGLSAAVPCASALELGATVLAKKQRHDAHQAVILERRRARQAMLEKERTELDEGQQEQQHDEQSSSSLSSPSSSSSKPLRVNEYLLRMAPPSPSVYTVKKPRQDGIPLPPNAILPSPAPNPVSFSSSSSSSSSSDAASSVASASASPAYYPYHAAGPKAEQQGGKMEDAPTLIDIIDADEVDDVRTVPPPQATSSASSSSSSTLSSSSSFPSAAYAMDDSTVPAAVDVVVDVVDIPSSFSSSSSSPLPIEVLFDVDDDDGVDGGPPPLEPLDK